MGTSQSSPGAPGGVPMVPPWVPDPLPSATPPDSGEPDAAPDGQAVAVPPVPAMPLSPSIPIAPAGRFGPARTSLGQFAGSGATGDMRRGIGHYVRKGLGGSNTATRRFSGTARTAGTLYGALSAVSSGQATGTGSPLDPSLLAGRSAGEIIDAVVEAVRPVDGTQDGEFSRNAIHGALSELLAQFPDADLLNLTDDQRTIVVEGFIGLDIFHRVQLDVGMAVQDKSPTYTVALSRLREIKNYIKQAISAQFRRLRAAGQTLTARRVSEIARQTIHETLIIFEGYAE